MSASFLKNKAKNQSAFKCLCIFQFFNGLEDVDARRRFNKYSEKNVNPMLS